MRSALTTLLLMLSSALSAQNRGTISGSVISPENKPVEKATISVLNKQDSTVLAYTLTDDKGKFTVYRLPLNKKLALVISHVGLSTFESDFILATEKTEDFGRITLESHMLDEVVVHAGQAPIRMNKDTLEYNTDYFKTRPGANIEALLKQLPGLQINLDGTIYYQGKEVNSVKVNGKDFFAQDLRIATRNLEAEMVQTVQVYRDKGDSKKAVENENDLPITINLKFKKSLVRTDFGKAYASGGTRDRYEAGALLNTFRDTLQVSLIGFGNNINRQAFDYSELSQHAGLGRSENYGFGSFGGNNYFGVGNDISGGTNINYDWGQITKLNIMYLYAYKNTLQNSYSESETDYDITTQFSKSSSNNEQKRHQHTLNGKFQHKFDTTAFIRFEPKLAFNKNKSMSASSNDLWDPSGAINSGANSSNNRSDGFNYNHTLYLEKNYYKKATVSLNYNQSLNRNNNDIQEQQYTVVYGESGSEILKDIINSSPSNDRNSNIRLGIQVPMGKKLRADVFGQFNYYDMERLQLISASNSTVSSLRNDVNFHSWEYLTGGSLNWNIIKRFSVTAGMSYLQKNNTFDYLNLLPIRQDKQHYWLPTASMVYKNLHITYNKKVDGPAVYSIQTVDNTINELYHQLASPYFENIVSDTYNLSFSNYSNKGSFYISGNYTTTDKSIGHNTDRDLTTGRASSMSYQAKGNSQFYASAFYHRSIKLSESWQLMGQEQVNSNLYQQYVTINDIENKSSSWHHSLRQNFTLSWKQWLGISPSYEITWNNNTNSVQNENFRDIQYLTHAISMGASVNNVKHMTLECSYTLRNQAGGLSSNRAYNLINASLYYDFKNEGQLKFSAFDILDQNNNVGRGGSANSIYYYESNTLRQYFLLGYVYKFSKSKMK